MGELSKTKIKKWLHRLAAATKKLNDIEDYSKGIRACKTVEDYCTVLEPMPYVHLANGIHEIGKLLGLDVVRDKETDRFIYYHFIFEDVLFIQLDEKEE